MEKEIPRDAPEADVQEQSQEWVDDEEDEKPELPPDAPEADVLDQKRSAGLADPEEDR